jgi:hypothetical protein
VIKHERIAHEPDIEYLKKTTGFKHAFVVWIPYGEVNIEKSWRRLYFTDHFEETGYAELDSRGQITDSRQELQSIDYRTPRDNQKIESYLFSWNERSRRARKKFLSFGTMVKAVDSEEFARGFRDTKVKHWYKSAYISYYKRMVDIDASKIRQWLAYDPS